MDNIKELINKFYDGTTTIEEEYELRRILCEEELPAEIEREKALLLAMLPGECEIPEGLEARLETLIDNFAEKKGAPSTNTTTPMGQRRRILKIPQRPLWGSLAAAAATVVLIFMLHNREQRPQDTFSTPEEAAIHINATFAHLAMVMNSGRENSINTAAQLQSIGATAKNQLTKQIIIK